MNNLYGWEMSQQLSVDGFKWVQIASQFNKDFMQNYNEDNDKGHFIEVDVQYLENL